MKNKESARFSNGKQSSQKISRKQTRIKEAKGSRKQSRQSLRKGQRNAKRKSAKTAERKKKRKRKRKLSGGKNESARKGKRRKRRKQKRAKLRKIEESRLGKPIPKEKVEIFRENFQRGKEKAGKEKGFLKSVENPFEKKGRLRADFRQLVRDKVLI